MGFIGDILGGIGDFFGDLLSGIGDFVFNAIGGIFENPLSLLTLGMGLMGLPTPMSMIFEGVSGLASSVGTTVSGWFTGAATEAAGSVIAGGADLALSGAGGFGAEAFNSFALDGASDLVGAGGFGADAFNSFALDGASGAADSVLAGASEFGAGGFGADAFNTFSMDSGGGILSEFADFGIDNAMFADTNDFGFGMNSGDMMNFGGGTDGITFENLSEVGVAPDLASPIAQSGTTGGGLLSSLDMDMGDLLKIGGGVFAGLHQEQMLEDQFGYSQQLMERKAELERQLALDIAEDKKANRVSFGVSGTETDTSNRIQTENELKEINRQLIDNRNVTTAPRYQNMLPENPNTNYNSMLERSGVKT